MVLILTPIHVDRVTSNLLGERQTPQKCFI